MHEEEKVEVLFTYLDETATYLQRHLKITYLDGVAEAGENLFTQSICQTLSKEQTDALQKLLEDMSDITYEKEEMRKAFQLAVLKGMKGATQPHHSMTPDAVSLFVSYIVNKVIDTNKGSISLVDLAVGSGNLLHTLLNQAPIPIHARAFEVDETLLKLAFVSANLQKHEIDFFHEDSIEPLPFPKVDLVVTDMPTGYYPKDDIAKDYVLRREQGHSFIHYLMIEQAISITKEGGFCIFIIPNFLFQSEDANKLNAYIKEHTNIIGLLQLPKTMFQSEKYGKSIFILQKKKDGIRQPKQALLVELPSFSNEQALASIVQKINLWFQDELGLF